MKKSRLLFCITSGILVFFAFSCKQMDDTPNDQVTDSSNDNRVELRFEKGNPDASGEMLSRTFRVGEEITLGECGFQLAGHSYAGWTEVPSPEAGSEVYHPGKTFIIQRNMTLYTQWTQDSIAENIMVRYVANAPANTTVQNSMNGQVTPKGDHITLPVCSYEIEKWKFLGWSDHSTIGGGTRYQPGNQYLIPANSGSEYLIYALWERVYEITFDKNDSAASGTMYSQKVENPLGSTLISNRFTKKGWTFRGWSTTPNGQVEYLNEDKMFNINSDKILYAQWREPDTFSAGDRGPAGGWIIYDHGWVTSMGWRYIELAPEDITSANHGLSWGLENIYIAEATNTGISQGSGLINTKAILSAASVNHTSAPAAEACMNYTVIYKGIRYEDWYLPSQRELHEAFLLFQPLSNIVSIFPGGDGTGYYWSSNQSNDPNYSDYSNRALKYGFGLIYANSGKSDLGNVRAVRYF